MSLLTNTQEFNTYKKRVSELLFPEKEIEDNIFRENFEYFIAFDFDYIFEEVFFEGIQIFLKKINESNSTFYTLTPSQEEYYYQKFGKYSTFNIGTDQSYQELYDKLYEDPGNNTGNYIGVVSNDIVWFSNSNDWVIVASRDLEIAICGFSTFKTKKQFEDSFNKNIDIFSSIEEYIEDLNNMLSFNEEQWRYYNKILNNYK
ncbi:hypothetical protein [Elizabethkingia anophelis]|uniref:hypothetical protein n=2 Tax=Elizabethkingia anophelis TaxID=1117645 RepID=UPI0004E42D72|nr:hypothetical protein [Elizabethkingia anophelis]KFC39396.1 hypothetical protein FF18_13945 [Elizabethkingia anophelis]MCT3699164.1 hypothetical protein [Elizabethkingia anophelis]MCT3787142.1 hypothetical protein [Elizabethkingia anophelis]MDV3500668.1 hypothetical protein [Elizabethkingia anophelis]MDV3548388.1 hypothetical protein [Elizabethkingia anophelis]